MRITRPTSLLVLALPLALLATPASAVQADPPVITPQFSARGLTIVSNADGTSGYNEVGSSTTDNGPFSYQGQSSGLGDKGSTASGAGVLASEIGAFAITLEGNGDAAASTSDPDGNSSQVTGIEFQTIFTIPSESTFAMTGSIEADGTGALAEPGVFGGRAYVSVLLQGTRPDGVPISYLFNVNETSTEPVEFAVSDPIMPNSVLVFQVSANARAANNGPGFAGSDFHLQVSFDVGDRDADGLLDTWETDGIDLDDDGTPEIDLQAIASGTPGGGTLSPDRKTLFVELDAHDGVPFDADAIELVRQAFANAPVTNADGSTGIDIFFVTDETDLTNEEYNGNGWPAEFDAAKADHFGTPALRARPDWPQLKEAYKLVFRYGIWGQTIYKTKTRNDGSTYRSYFSGKAELPGNDFFVAGGEVASWYTDDALRTNALAGTLMHEFGHTLNLRHGGQENLNYKPNYLSVMNYAYQIPMDGDTVEGTPVADAWFLDYSRTAPSSLNENMLREDAGLDGPEGRKILFNTSANGLAPALQIADADAAQIDWNLSGQPIETEPVQVDISRFSGTSDVYNAKLESFTDWNRLWFSLSGAADFADGSHASSDQIEEFDFDDFTEINSLVVHDRSTPSCPADLNGDGVADQGDIQSFIALFLAQDTAVDFNGDGIVDQGDIQGFIAEFLEGC